MKTIYVDNSVFGGKYDPEFELWTDLFLKKFNSDILSLLSEVGIHLKEILEETENLQKSRYVQLKNIII